MYDSISGAGTHLRLQLLNVFRIRRIAAAAKAAATTTATAGRRERGPRGRTAALVLACRRPQAPLVAVGGLPVDLLTWLSRGPHETAHQLVVDKCTLGGFPGGAPLACGSVQRWLARGLSGGPVHRCFGPRLDDRQRSEAHGCSGSSGAMEVICSVLLCPPRDEGDKRPPTRILISQSVSL